ncbi:uncharacterized protein LOC131228898 [Magnolia sinica]|uniref:uncharacterized protein LOC131228898 n=1 Tax=Magnolia sinica TaxID=86752 RepID=UPI002657D7FF|nr:uncharacterized protein LOC131228898 [Magnolia sinica]
MAMKKQSRGRQKIEIKRIQNEDARQVEEEKRKKAKLDCVVRNGQDLFWWESPIENMRLDELEQFGASMEELRKKVRKRADEMLVEASSSTAFLGMNSVGVVDPFMVEAPTVITRSFGFGRGLF